MGARSSATLCGYWHHLKTFARFVAVTGAMHRLRNANSESLPRYVEWLNRQRTADGEPSSVNLTISPSTVPVPSPGGGGLQAVASPAALVPCLSVCAPQIVYLNFEGVTDVHTPAVLSSCCSC